MILSLSSGIHIEKGFFFRQGGGVNFPRISRHRDDRWALYVKVFIHVVKFVNDCNLLLFQGKTYNVDENYPTPQPILTLMLYLFMVDLLKGRFLTDDEAS